MLCFLHALDGSAFNSLSGMWVAMEVGYVWVGILHDKQEKSSCRNGTCLCSITMITPRFYFRVSWIWNWKSNIICHKKRGAWELLARPSTAIQGFCADECWQGAGHQAPAARKSWQDSCDNGRSSCSRLVHTVWWPKPGKHHWVVLSWRSTILILRRVWKLWTNNLKSDGAAEEKQSLQWKIMV